jgi:hypothetical protein
VSSTLESHTLANLSFSRGLFSRRLFTPEWGQEAIAPALAFLQSKGAMQVALWCRSFGGFLCAQAGALLSSSLSAVVLDGGISDMYQNTLCALPQQLQIAYATNRSAFDAITTQVQQSSVSLNSLMGWAEVGFNVTSLGALLDAFEPYFLLPDEIASLARVPLFVNNPQLDTTTGHQSHLLWEQLQKAGNVSAQSELFSPSISSGSALHCGVGSSFSNSANILTWLIRVFGQ